MLKKIENVLSIVICVIIGGILLDKILPPPIDIYRSISTREVVKIETNEGVVTNKVAIKNLLYSHSDQETYWIP